MYGIEFVFGCLSAKALLLYLSDYFNTHVYSAFTSDTDCTLFFLPKSICSKQKINVKYPVLTEFISTGFLDISIVYVT